jgi:hypothetical protein
VAADPKLIVDLPILQIERDKGRCSLEITLFKVFPGAWPLVIASGLHEEKDMDASSHFHMGTVWVWDNPLSGFLVNSLHFRFCQTQRLSLRARRNSWPR